MVQTTYDFDCGCKFPVTNSDLKTIDGLPSIKIDYENLNYRCPSTWSLFGEGKTKGIFQLETNLGQSWAKKVQPICVEEIAALISIMRPGCLKGLMEDGKSVSQHYVDRKDFNEEFFYFHDEAEPILRDTYGLMVYQEQILSIAKIFAGFSLQQADTLRKGIGKKKADIVAKCRDEFVSGCINKGIITEHDAVVLFDVIEKSNRYSFNLSHAVSYGVTGYWCAVPKHHFPLHFFTAWLSGASGKIKPREEIAELIQDTKSFGIVVENPNISYKNENFVMRDGKIRYGLGSIKSVGAVEVQKLLASINQAEQKLNKPLIEFDWHDTLIHILSQSRKDVVSNLIHAGALSHYGLSRNAMLFQYNKLCELNDKEVEWIISHTETDNLHDDIANMLSNKKTVATRKTKLQNLLVSIEQPSLDLADSIDVVAKREEDVLGISISCSRLDGKNTGFVNCTCDEFNKKKKTHKVIVAMQISRVTEWSPPKTPDKKLCFLTGYDKTGKIEVMIPEREYKEFSFLLFHGNTVAIHGSMNEKKGNLIGKVVTQL